MLNCNLTFLTHLTRHISSQKSKAEMKPWSVQDAKAHFSEFLDTCLKDGPQLVTRRGEEAAVLVPVQDWRRMQAAGKPTFKELLLMDEGRGDMNIPPRGKFKRKHPMTFPD